MMSKINVLVVILAVCITEIASLKWGIASAGKIASDFVNAMSTLEPGKHEVWAVAARQLDRAENFSKIFNVKHAYEGYINLATDPNVEIVYIGAVTSQHYKIAKMMLENGKHVLCETSMAYNYKQVKELIEIARSKSLFLMEAVWSRLLPVYKALQAEINSGRIGEVVDISARMVPVLVGYDATQLGGSTLYYGIYALQIAQLLYKEYPKDIVATGVLNSDGVDITTDIKLKFSKGRTADISPKVEGIEINEVRITGTNGTVKIHKPFWAANKYTNADGDVQEWPLPKGKVPFNYENVAGLSFEAEECRRCIEAGLLESEANPLSDTLELTKLKDAIRLQIGVKFSVDD